MILRSGTEKGSDAHAGTRLTCAATGVPRDAFAGPVAASVLGTIGVRVNGRRRRSGVRIKIHGRGACAFCFPKSAACDERTSPCRYRSDSHDDCPGTTARPVRPTTTTTTRCVCCALVTRCSSTPGRPTTVARPIAADMSRAHRALVVLLALVAADLLSPWHRCSGPAVAASKTTNGKRRSRFVRSPARDSFARAVFQT